MASRLLRLCTTHWFVTRLVKAYPICYFGISRTKERDSVSLIFKALADPTRRRILELLRERERSAGELAEHFELAKPTLSGHFAVLREAKLVETQKQGTSLIYRLNVSVLEEALLALVDGLRIGAARPESERAEPAREPRS